MERNELKVVRKSTFVLRKNGKQMERTEIKVELEKGLLLFGQMGNKWKEMKF